MVLTRTAVVALVGNPNTGKTTLFNALAGMRQRVGNYPGVTVETKTGQITCDGQVMDLVDLPGTYSLAPRSPDEMVAVELLLGQLQGEQRPDLIIAIVDASNLERNLYLTTQVMELGVPVVLALNMVDVAQRHQLLIDVDGLARRLGIPVIPVQANKCKGLDELRRAVAEAFAKGGAAPAGVMFPDDFDREVRALQEHLGSDLPLFLVRRVLLDVGGYAEQRICDRFGSDLREHIHQARGRLAGLGPSLSAVEARARYAWIRQVVAPCVQRPAGRPVTGTDRLDRVLTHQLWGTLVFLAVMFLVFQSIFTWARPVMKVISAAKDYLAEALHGLLPPGPLSSLLTDGILEGVGSVIVFLPQIAILFGFIAILEDCGYMARAAFLMDKLMARCGLSGKSFIPLLSSVACAVPGIMATRVIENRRDRLATIVVAPLMSCSARLPVFVLLIGAFLTERMPWWTPGLAMFGMYALGLVLAPAIALLLKRTLLRGETPAFVMEMPLYKWPSLHTVLRRVYDSSWAFLRRAGTLILAAMILVWALLYFPRNDAQGTPYDERIAAMEDNLKGLQHPSDSDGEPRSEEIASRIEQEQAAIDALYGEWKRQSLLGRTGRWLEPAFKPLGWDWRVGMAALASFPAREVVVGTLGIIYNQGRVDSDEIRDAERAGETKLGRALQAAAWDGDPNRKVFSIPTALSLMVFFALCCQCASTLAIMRRETNSWRWPLFTFVYMTALAYFVAFLVYQVGSWLPAFPGGG